MYSRKFQKYFLSLKIEIKWVSEINCIISILLDLYIVKGLYEVKFSDLDFEVLNTDDQEKRNVTKLLK